LHLDKANRQELHWKS